MSSLRILSLPLGNLKGKELSIVSDWDKDQGYVTALQEADSLGNSTKRHAVTHPNVRDAVKAAIKIYDDFVEKRIV